MLMTIQAQNEGVDIEDIHMDFHNGRPLECMYAEVSCFYFKHNFLNSFQLNAVLFFREGGCNTY